MSVDRPLTDAQERALILLADYADRYGPTPYARPWGVQERTLEVLARLGYVDTQERPTSTVGRINDRGRELLRGMGD